MPRDRSSTAVRVAPAATQNSSAAATSSGARSPTPLARLTSGIRSRQLTRSTTASAQAAVATIRARRSDRPATRYSPTASTGPAIRSRAAVQPGSSSSNGSRHGRRVASAASQPAVRPAKSGDGLDRGLLPAAPGRRDPLVQQLQLRGKVLPGLPFQPFAGQRRTEDTVVELLPDPGVQVDDVPGGLPAYDVGVGPERRRGRGEDGGRGVVHDRAVRVLGRVRTGAVAGQPDQAFDLGDPGGADVVPEEQLGGQPGGSLGVVRIGSVDRAVEPDRKPDRRRICGQLDQVVGEVQCAGQVVVAVGAAVPIGVAAGQVGHQVVGIRDQVVPSLAQVHEASFWPSRGSPACAIPVPLRYIAV